MLPTRLQGKVPVASAMLANALTPAQLVREASRIASDCWAPEKEVHSKSPMWANRTKPRSGLASRARGHRVKNPKSLCGVPSSSNTLLGQQAHEVGGGVGVQSQRRHRDIGGCMGPVLVVVVQACERGVCIGGFGQHHLPWKKSQKHNLEAPGLRHGWAVHLTMQLKELSKWERLVPAPLGTQKPRAFHILLTLGRGQGF